MKIKFLLQKALRPLIIVILPACVYLANQYVSVSSDDMDLRNQCNFVDLECDFAIFARPAVARFSAPPTIEEPITLNLITPQDAVIESIWIEGVNMYMGKIPVSVDSIDANQWSGWFMLGSCAEPLMRWRMVVNIKDQPTPVFLYFTTSS
ncbi:hypothetical protein CA267_018810 [Alteromonas pelagimontana]|uniref:Uncharacterized protein n=1 Tax=Alteromonas pelagimontana TaxID=1858656 RepID=A0A6M4M816_9ALTE|nr:hypothetical protein [Alteromonas pelagimontana]QJR79297.1 hypothetical protein CA267_000025 [Alteromonas pelagimontana]QJR82655.1 hypothetical protein CA267_018810 [Alteromonas pelagimontana]